LAKQQSFNGGGFEGWFRQHRAARMTAAGRRMLGNRLQAFWARIEDQDAVALGLMAPKHEH
jgi:hypothetical protein